MHGSKFSIVFTIFLKSNSANFICKLHKFCNFGLWNFSKFPKEIGKHCYTTLYQWHFHYQMIRYSYFLLKKERKNRENNIMKCHIGINVPLCIDYNRLCTTVKSVLQSGTLFIFWIFSAGLYSSFCHFLLNKSFNFRDCIRDRTLIESGL